MMSRLERMIVRVTAQRECLNAAAEQISDVNGVVLELGLGNGRTYDHLRSLLPRREIFVFDREVAAHPECIPDDHHMIVGKFKETIPDIADRIKMPAALIHGDFGTAYPELDAKLAAWLGPSLTPIVQGGTIVVTDRELTTVPWIAIPLPVGVQSGAYFMYRVPNQS